MSTCAPSSYRRDDFYLQQSINIRSAISFLEIMSYLDRLTHELNEEVDALARRKSSGGRRYGQLSLPERPVLRHPRAPRHRNFGGVGEDDGGAHGTVVANRSEVDLLDVEVERGADLKGGRRGAGRQDKIAQSFKEMDGYLAVWGARYVVCVFQRQRPYSSRPPPHRSRTDRQERGFTRQAGRRSTRRQCLSRTKSNVL